ncbi:rhomboid-domain-containing protein [Piromyces finnis]|uniref:Rhomboid-type serine protease n=1 Tax=Piromyces finnis TaxID=1754191 RepID=A0A1Y1UXF5_9FUNG|nr:rhomboid-domain-containing protein [Piromyces finnis]|eukprot:ORX42866.1 rhomboid-domain-containing protein [Piromyces finnis]
MSRYNRGDNYHNNNGYNRLQDENNYGGNRRDYGYRENGYRENEYRGNGYRENGYRENGYRENGYRNDNYRNNTQASSEGYRYRDNRNFNNQAPSYSNNAYSPQAVKQPPAAVTKKEQPPPNTYFDGKKQQKIKSALFNPKVREQLENQKKYKPYFIYSISAIQILIFFVSIVINFISTKQIISPIKYNFFIGPSSGVLVRMGARYIPCMYGNSTVFDCLPGTKGTLLPTEIALQPGGGTLKKSPFYCTGADVCGFGVSADAQSYNQWFRFIIPIFLHSGIIHLVFNLIFQIRAGAALEKDYGPWRMALVYFFSGIFGFLFEAKSFKNPTVGCSGSLYGLISCVLLDLVQNWKLVIHPWKDLILLLSSIVISLGFGLLPFIDNFSHIGGFVMGVLTGLIFLPSIIFSNKDEKRKQTLKIIAVFLAIALYVWVILQFYRDSKPCEWCQNLSCPKFFSSCKKKYKSN